MHVPSTHDEDYGIVVDRDRLFARCGRWSQDTGGISLAYKEPLQRVRAAPEEALRERSRDRRGDVLPSEDSPGQLHRRGHFVHSTKYGWYSSVHAGFHGLAEYLVDTSQVWCQKLRADAEASDSEEDHRDAGTLRSALDRAFFQRMLLGLRSCFKHTQNSRRYLQYPDAVVERDSWESGESELHPQFFQFLHRENEFS